jgi:putative ABC transport system permease protein
LSVRPNENYKQNGALTCKPNHTFTLEASRIDSNYPYGSYRRNKTVTIARRNLLKDKTRVALSVGGVALAVMLIVVLNGFLDGMNRQITSYLDHSPGTLAVAQEDVDNLLGATSRLPDGLIQQVEAVRGVDEAIPILSQFVILDLHGKKQPAYMVGYYPDLGGGPWELFAGRQPRTKREMVIDRVLAARHALKLGDTVEILGKEFTIVGLSNHTTSWMTSFFFLRKDAVEDLLLSPGATSYLLLTTSNGVDLDDLLKRLNTLSGVNALSKKEMATNDLKLFAKVFSAPLKLMVGIAFLVGTMIVGLVIYTITVERQREYGVIKAIGAANRVLYKVVLTQALAAASLGAVTGLLLAYGLSQWIMTARPQFLIVFDRYDVSWALLAGLAMAIVATLFPAHVMANLEPAEVFRR